VTGALLDRPRSFSAGSETVPAGGGRVTLEERLTAALRAARTSGNTECPVCHARMTREAEAARCGGCGSRLS
jgi:hypothetical protein